MKHFFDVGANIGQTFADFLNPRPSFDGWEVWCFEPSPRHMAELLQAAKQQCGRYAVHICPFGLGGISGARAFYAKDDPRGDSFQEHVTSDHDTCNQSDGYSILAISIEIGSFIFGNTAPDDEIVLKLDCEGSEYEILQELLTDDEARGRVKQVYVEWHHIGATPGMSSQQLSEEYGRKGLPLENWMF
jgi:FkbM family methyltransferase